MNAGRWRAQIPGEVTKTAALTIPQAVNPDFVLQNQQRNIDSVRLANKTTLRFDSTTVASASSAWIAMWIIRFSSTCMRHCLGMLSMKDTSMAACTNSAYQLIAACGALRTLAAVNSSYVPALAKVIAQVCVDCQKECEKFPDVAECKACGDSCKTCAEECRKISA